MKRLRLFCCAAAIVGLAMVPLLIANAFAAAGKTPTGALSAVSSLHFEANVGQEQLPASFIGRAGARTLFIEPGRIQIASADPRVLGTSNSVQLEFVGANRRGAFVPIDELSTRANYFRGPKEQWRTGVREYARLRYRSLYSGVDLVLHSDASGNALEYDFEVSPRTDVSRIAVRFAGARDLRLDRNGELVIETADGTLRQRRPVAYQTIDGRRVAVLARYEVGAGHRAKIVVGEYRHDQPLTIDPALVYSTVLNGAAAGDASSATATATYTDSTGHLYTYVAGCMNPPYGNCVNTGGTSETDFPIKKAYQIVPNPGFIAKLDISQAGAASAVYVTYFDGHVTGMALDGSGDVYVVGTTNSTTFPFVNGHSAVGHAFLTKFSPDGTNILYSTLSGGSTSGDYFSGVAVTPDGTAFAVGNTWAADLPLVNPLQSYQPPSETGSTGFVQALNTNISGAASLVYSTYVSGNNVNAGTALNAVAVDSAKHIYIAGSTRDNTFPIVNGFSSTFNYSPLLAVIDPTKSGSSQLIYSTLIGGSAASESYAGTANAIALDALSNVYVTGATSDPGLPVSSSAYQPQLNGSDSFVVKINPSLSGPASLLNATYLGGHWPDYFGGDFGNAIALDGFGNVFVSGGANSVDFPLLNPTVPASSGLVQSLDRGNSWQIVNSTPLASGNGFGGLEIDATTTPRTLYMVTNRKGVLKSTDGGLNWNFANSGLADTHTNGIGARNSFLMDPTNASNLFVGSDSGVFRSTDGAETWTQFLPAEPIVAQALDSGYFYWGDASGLYRTPTTGTGAGQNWTQLSTFGVASIAIDTKTTPHILYAAGFDQYDGDVDNNALWMSTDDGSTWTDIGQNGSGGPNAPNYPEFIAVDTSTSPSTLWVFGYWDDCLKFSSDYGATWSTSPGLGLGDVAGIVFDNTTSPTTVYVSDGSTGIWRSSSYGQQPSDNSDTWTEVINGSFHALALDPMTSAGNPPVVYAFTGDATPNAFVAELDNTLSTLKFSTLLGGIGGYSAANALSVDGSGNMYVAGLSQSPAFPLLNAYNSSLGNSAFLAVVGTPTLPTSSSSPVTTTVATSTGSLNLTMPDITGSTTASAPTVSVTPLSSTATANFQLSDNLGAYDISTTATFDGSVTLCFQALTVNDVATFDNLTILHIVNGVAVNITSSYDFSTRTICGTTSSFSPFVLVKGAVGQLQDIVQYVDASDLRHGIDTSLDSKLQNAESAFSSASGQDYNNACNMVGSFINNVQAQTGNAITTSESAHMIAAAKQVMATIGCSQ